ncbi:NAD(P)H-binding protein [Chryseolinea sp. H1M3-3]|uniref:NAD(P)-dependent oxidoreductase n=1 Tax=Chryseolinea sp. H1M3-3 TaxID=3034144 RepID=UPI0023ED55E7|nr:NAD(P)H-binding protein [Chryseolinea sp. H1M3-3]
MRILLLGATGRTGKYVLEEAIQKGYDLHCLVRNSQRITIRSKQLTIIEGNPENLVDLEKAIQGCEAVISVLNVSRTSDFPWAKLRTPPTFMSQVVRNLIQLAATVTIKRIIVCSAWGASDTRKDLPALFRWLIDHSNIGYAYRDHELQEKLLKESSLAWTIVRPVGLTNSKKYQQVVESYDNKPRPGMTITRCTVARYLVDAIQNESLIHQAPVISGG